MNDIYNGPLSRGVSHVEASAGTATNAAASLATDSNRTGQIQVPRSPQPLSLQVNGLEAGVYSQSNSNISYVESSERGSETSDSQRPELHSASTLTDSAPSQLSSSLNESNRSMEFDNISGGDGDVQMSNTNQEASPMEALHSLQPNGNGPINGTNGAVKLEKQSNGPLSPLRSPNHLNARPGANLRYTPGHKRTATGDVKSISALTTLASSDSNGAARRRSKSTGSPAHGSRIAQVRVTFRCLTFSVIDIRKAVRPHSHTPIICSSKNRKVSTVAI